MHLYLVRGLPGAGKSTLARSLGRVIEADQFFIESDGVYRFDAGRLRMAHAWCQSEAFTLLAEGVGHVAVANTFVKLWELRPYVELAKLTGAKLTVLTVEGDHGNIHGVPAEVVERMRANFEPYSLEKCLAAERPARF